LTETEFSASIDTMRSHSTRRRLLRAGTWATLALLFAARGQAQIPTFTPIETFTPIQSFTPIETFTPFQTFTPIQSFTPIPTSTVPNLRTHTPTTSPTPSLTGLATVTPTSGTPGTPSVTPTRVATRTPTGVPIPSDTVPAPQCVGDCDGDVLVSIDELTLAVLIAIGRGTIDDCRAIDVVADGVVTVDELVRAVLSALRGCV
jgi:hypothetical protein